MRCDGLISLVIFKNSRRKDHNRSSTSPSVNPNPSLWRGLIDNYIVRQVFVAKNTLSTYFLILLVYNRYTAYRCRHHLKHSLTSQTFSTLATISEIDYIDSYKIYTLKISPQIMHTCTYIHTYLTVNHMSIRMKDRNRKCKKFNRLSCLAA